MDTTHAEQLHCDACNAEPGEPCQPDCIGLAAEFESIISDAVTPAIGRADVSMGLAEIRSLLIAVRDVNHPISHVIARLDILADQLLNNEMPTK